MKSLAQRIGLISLALFGLQASVTGLVAQNVPSAYRTSPSRIGLLAERAEQQNANPPTGRAEDKPSNSSAAQLPPKFPPAYSGDDPVKAYSLLAARQAELVKSEFETSQAFRERVNTRLTGLKVSTGRSFADPFTLVTTDFENSYDADAELLTLRINTENRSPIVFGLEGDLVNSFYRPLPPIPRRGNFLVDSPYANHFMTVELRNNSRTIGRRVGRNAFGVRVSYVIMDYTSVRLAIRGTNLYSSILRLGMKLTAAKARSLSGHIGVAFTGDLRFPFTFHESSVDAATITDRVEAHYSNFYLFMEANALVVFDKRTGEILGMLAFPVPERKEMADLWDVGLERPRSILQSNGVDQPTVAESRPVDPFQVSGSPKKTDDQQKFDSRVLTDKEVTSKARVLSKPEPQYTEEARKNRITGTVVLRAVFTSNGQVTNIRSVSGLPFGLTERAIAAARQIKFSPAMEDGRPVSTYVTLEYNFNL